MKASASDFWSPGGNHKKRQSKRTLRRLEANVRLERLEERQVLSTLDLTSGVLSYSAASGNNNNVTFAFNSATNTDILSDSGDTIVLTANAIAAGVTVDPSGHTATIPDGPVGSIIMNTGDGTDTFHIQSVIEPLSISPTNNAGGTQTVFLGNALHGVQDITNNVSINNALGTTTLNVDDSANTAVTTSATVSGTSISNILGGGSVNITTGSLSALNIFGGTQNDNVTFTGTPTNTMALNTGTGAGTTTVRSLSSTATLDITAAHGAVKVGNSGDTSAVLGHVDLNNTNNATMEVDDSVDSTARTFVVKSTGITGFNATGNVTFNAVGALTVRGGSGGNTFDVQSTQASNTTSLFTGDGADAVYVSGAGTGSTLNLNGGAGADQIFLGDSSANHALGLTTSILANSVNITKSGATTAALVIDDSNDTTALSVAIAADSVTGMLGVAASPVNYASSALSSLLLKGGSGGNTYNLNTDGSPGYPISIDMGTGNDSLVFADGASTGGGAIDGQAGVDTLDYSAYTTAVSVDLNASPQTATGIGTGANIENAIGGSGGNTFTAPVGVDSTLTGGSGNDTFIIPAGAGNVTVVGNGGTDDLQISASSGGDNFNQVVVGATVQTTITDPTAHTVTSTGMNSIELNGGSGDSTATIDFSGGNPIPAGGETFSGGGGTNNTLVLVNDLPGGAPSFTNETYTATGPGAGNIDLDGSTIGFTGLSPVIDTVSVTNYTFNAPAAPNTISLTPTTANGLPGTLIASADTPPGFESAAIANKTNVTVNSTGPLDATVSVNDPGVTQGLATLTINTGGGTDFVTLIATPTGAPVTVNTANGSDTVNVNAAGLGAAATVNGGPGVNNLIFDAGNTTTAQTTTTLIAGASPTLTYLGFTNVAVNNILDLPLVNTAATITAVEGSTFSGIVGSFSASNPAPVPNQVNPIEAASDFTASIAWGDGTTSAGTIVANGTGGFDVIGTHTYADESTPDIVITVTHNQSKSTATSNGIVTTLQTNGGSTTTINSTATVQDAPLSSSGVNVLGVEGAPIAVGTLVATFSDSNTAATVGEFTATIDWGDGTTSAGVITVAGGPISGFLVRSGTAHTYAEEGNYSVTVTINDVGGATTLASSNATIADAPLSATGTAVLAVDGNPFTGQVATFTDANPTAPLSDFTATINWGNGVITSGTITQPGGVGTAFVVTGSQTYKAGSYPISVTINDAGGSTATATSTATVSAATLAPNGPGAALTVVEGQPFTAQLGEFTTGNPIANILQFSATIAWGDGSTSTGTITQSSAGVFTVTGTHTYAEESASNPITVTVNDINGPTTTITASAVVEDAPLSSAGVNVLGVEGAAIPAGTLVANFADADPAGAVGDYTATIFWGDGTSSAGVISVAGGAISGFQVTSGTPHTYLESGKYSITVAISDAGGSGTTAASQATIADAALTATGTAVSAVEGTPFTGQVATFTDANPNAPISDFTVAINWGDGIVSSGTVTQPGGVGTAFVVTGTHTYKFGTFPVTVSIVDNGGSVATATSTATVTGAALTPGSNAALTGTEGAALSGLVVGTFTSANPLATARDFTASVDWGDGTPVSTATIVEAPDGTFYVSSNHTYAEESGATPYAIVVTVKSTAGVTATLNATATIADAPLLATTQPIVAVEGQNSNLLVATFIDSNPLGVPSDFTVSINWGDGTTSAGVVTASGGSTVLGAAFKVTGTHTYAEEGQYVVTTTINDLGGSTASATSIATVVDAPLVGQGVPITGKERVPLSNVPVATFTDSGGPEDPLNYVATIDWGDGKPTTTGTIVLGSDGVTFTVLGSHTYESPGVYNVNVVVTDDGGARLHVVTTATISEVPFVITGRLDPASDSGISNSDNITNVVQPTFNGTSEPGSIINLYVSNQNPPMLIGSGVTDASGHWSIRSTVALADNAYVVTATATDPNNLNDVTGPVVLLGFGGTGGPDLVIDTTGPTVTETIFRRPLGQIIIAFQDLGVRYGFDPKTVLDGSFFRFSVYAKASYPPNLITKIQIVGSGSPTDPVEAILTINNGHPLRTGRYVLTIKSGTPGNGVSDIAGNPLDGEFYGYQPSGNGTPGGNFQALLVSSSSYTFRPFPTDSSASPKTPPGHKPTGYPTPSSHQTKAQHQAAVKAAAKAKAHAVHDAALAHVSVKAAAKKGK